MQQVLDALQQLVLPRMTAGIGAIVPGTARPLQNEAESFEFSSGTIDRDCYACSWMLEGSTTVRINGITYPFAPGDFYFLPPLTRHADLYDVHTAPNRFLYFIFGPREVVYGLGAYSGFAKFGLEFFGTFSAPPQLGGVFAALHREIASPSPYGGPVIHGLVLQLVGLLMRGLCESPAKELAPGQSSVAGRVLAYLRAHYAEELTLASIAKISYFTPTYLAAIFKRETGETIFEALARIRIDHAAALLREGDMPISLVASTVGYRNADQFSRVFRKLQGVPPTAYRQQSATSISSR